MPNEQEDYLDRHERSFAMGQMMMSTRVRIATERSEDTWTTWTNDAVQERELQRKARWSGLYDEDIPLIKMWFHILKYIQVTYHNEDDILLDGSTKHKSKFDRRVILWLKILQIIAKQIKFSPDCGDITLVKLRNFFTNERLREEPTTIPEEEIERRIAIFKVAPEIKPSVSIHKYVDLIDKGAVIETMFQIVKMKQDQEQSPSGFTIITGIKKFLDSCLKPESVREKLAWTPDTHFYNPAKASKSNAKLFFKGLKGKDISSVDLIYYVTHKDFEWIFDWVRTNFYDKLAKNINLKRTGRN